MWWLAIVVGVFLTILTLSLCWVASISDRDSPRDPLWRGDE